jgi:diamine N-acetyltransferase
MFIQSDSIYLRALEPTDLEFLYGLENDVSLWPVSNHRSPFSRSVLQEYLQHALADIYSVRQLRLLICLPDDHPIGTIDLYDFEPAHLRAGVGLVITKSCREKGYGFQALTSFQKYCRDYLHMHQLYCSIGLDNKISTRLFLKAGFTQVGIRKDWVRQPGGWMDVVEMQKILEE